MKKITLSVFLSLLCMSAMAEAVIGSHKSELGIPYVPTSISNNGKWATIQVGQQGDGVNLLWDLVNGSCKEVTSKDMKDYPSLTLDRNSVKDVSDDGVLVGAINEYPAVYRDGKWTVFDEFVNMGNINAISSDASVMVGYVSTSTDLSANPIIWKWNEADKKYVADTLEWSKNMKELSVRGAMATDVSGDGKIVVGVLQDNAGILPSVMWVYNEETKNYDIDFFSAEYVDFDALKVDDDHPFYSLFAGRARISANGKYITGEETLNKKNEYDWLAARYDVEKKELTVFGNYKEPVPCMATGIADDGTIVGWHQNEPGMMGRVGRIVLPGDSVPTSSVDYYKKNNVKNLPDLDKSSHATFIISPDSRKFLGMYMDDKMDINAYCVDLDGEIKSGIKEDVIVNDNSVCTMVGNELFINGEGVTNLYVVSVSGQIVYSIANPSNVVNLEHLNAGVYVVVALQNGKMVSSKISVR